MFRYNNNIQKLGLNKVNVYKFIYPLKGRYTT